MRFTVKDGGVHFSAQPFQLCPKRKNCKKKVRRSEFRVQRKKVPRSRFRVQRL
jgi:hypothetical protein